mmetsp:Transcript_85147/g.264555  ORF Transcript_85147/g.264555 Transcript_85147/m.264555 type:complete len:240 (-) Transcript_85147:432-1151(-)
MQVIGFPWPSFQLYSWPRGNSSLRSPMALWLTKTRRLSRALKSQLGHFAALASFRWNMPTPVAFRNSSKPCVATHFQPPKSGGAILLLLAATWQGTSGGGSGISSSAESAPPSSRRPSSARRSCGLSGSLLWDQLTMWSSSVPRDLIGEVGEVGWPAGAPPSSSEVTIIVRVTEPLGLFFLVRTKSFRSRWPMSVLQGMVTAPQSLSLWKRLRSQTATWRESGTLGELQEKLDSHFGSL